MEKTKTLKEENIPITTGGKMGVLGRGRGDFGLLKSKNIIFRILSFLTIVGLIYSTYIRDIFLVLGIIALYLIFVTHLARG